MWFRPWALAMRMIRFQESTSVGGYPVSGKMQHSSVPRRKIGRPLMAICVPCVPTSRMPNVTMARSCVIRTWSFAAEPHGHRIQERVGTRPTAGICRPSCRRTPPCLRPLSTKSGMLSRLSLHPCDFPPPVRSTIEIPVCTTSRVPSPALPVRLPRLTLTRGRLVLYIWIDVDIVDPDRIGSP